ncbi:MAG: preprotein translocase subunit SecY [Phycisphaerales bacterium]
MLQAFVNVFKIKELRNRLLFTIAMLAVYRIGFWIPIPGVDQQQLVDFFKQQADAGTALSRIGQFMSVFSGGSFSQSTIFGLGIMPYISAGIIFQLLSSAWAPLKKKMEEGPTGRQQIQEWTRYATVALCILQSIGWLAFITRSGLVYPNWANHPLWWAMAIMCMTAGCVFLMWLGEQIDKHGIGNGVSLIITAGILASMPNAVGWVINNSPVREIGFIQSIFGASGTGDPQLSWMGVLAIVAGFVFVTAGAVLITVAQRRIPIQQAKHTRGRKVFGGQRSFLPLRINHGGVMPVIFASSLMIFPSVIFSTMNNPNADPNHWWSRTASFLSDNFAQGQFLFVVFEIILIYFFSYFWNTVQFNPEDMSKQLRDHGSFIPGLRPGPRTAEYLETVMERVTYVGAGFLAVIALLPTVIATSMNIPINVSQFLGGTGLLICVSVGLDLIQRIEANLLMRNYSGFLGGAEHGGRGPKIRGRLA